MKKFLKFIKYSALIFLSATVAILLYLTISGKVFIGSTEDRFVRYLNTSKANIDKGFNDQSFDDDFYNSDVFLFGEMHGYAANQTTDKELFKYLNKKLGVRYYIAEMDSINANKLNHYLDAPQKNNDLLKEVVLAIGQIIPQQSSKELFEKWNELYDYNSNLPDSLKIEVIGVDINCNEKKAIIPRDAAMISNLRNTIRIKHLENEKFYGFFGFYHTLQGTPKGKDKPFAQRLKHSNFNVTSLVSFTLDSEMYLPNNSGFPTPENERIKWMNTDGPFMLVKGINDLKATTKENSITLFKLDNSQSPYKNSQNLITIKSIIFGEDLSPENEVVNTTDWFQYVILLRNSKANTPIK